MMVVFFDFKILIFYIYYFDKKKVAADHIFYVKKL